MRIYVGFDDTDTIDADRGTGKLARWFEQAIPEGGRLWGVVRQQLLLDPGIPYTSHNSSACAVIECEERAPMIDLIIEKAIAHIDKYALPGSDPGLCVVSDVDPCLPDLKRFGIACTQGIVTQKDALKVDERLTFIRPRGDQRRHYRGGRGSRLDGERLERPVYRVWRVARFSPAGHRRRTGGKGDQCSDNRQGCPDARAGTTS